jgi:hypothetical protein
MSLKAASNIFSKKIHFYFQFHLWCTEAGLSYLKNVDDDDDGDDDDDNEEWLKRGIVIFY